MGAAHSTTDTFSPLRSTSAAEAAQVLVLNAEVEAKLHDMQRQDRQMVLKEEAMRRQMFLQEETHRFEMQRQDAEDKARIREKRFKSLFYGAVAGVSALALVGMGSYLYRTYSKAFRVSRCKRALRSGLQQFASMHVPTDVTQPSSEWLMLNAPYMYCVFGASGSGKTAMLERVARQAALDGRPGIFLRLRSLKMAKGTVDPMTVFSDIAKMIDFPVPSTFAEVTAWTALTLAPLRNENDKKSSVSIRSVLDSILPRPRVADMAYVLLSAVEELAQEALRHGGKAPVIIFDEVADLVCVERLRDAGGDGFFDVFASAGVWLNEGSHVPVTWVLSSGAVMWHKRLPAGRCHYIFVPEATPTEIDVMIATELNTRRSQFTAQDFAYVCDRVGLRVRYWRRVLTAIRAGRSVQDAVNDLEETLRGAIEQKASLLFADEDVRRFLQHLISQPAMRISELRARLSFADKTGEPFQLLCEAQVLTWYKNELMFHSRFAYRWVCQQLDVPVVPFVASSE
jgi:hypothetical protein